MVGGFLRDDLCISLFLLEVGRQDIRIFCAVRVRAQGMTVVK